MARAHSSDVPSFDAYPAPAPAEGATASPDMPNDWPYEPKTDEFSGVQNQRLNQTAEQIGETLGRLVAATRTARQRIDSVRSEAGAELSERVDALSEQARERIDALRETANERLEDASERIDALRERASDRIEALRAAASERLEDLRDKTQRGLACGRERAERRVEQAREYARENPEKVIGGALLAGLAIGIGVRIWNSSRRSEYV